MTYPLRCALALALLACACQPLVFPRTAEIAERGHLSVQGSGQIVAIEPQSVVDASGTGSRSTVGFVPDVDLQAHVGLGRCETGLVLVDFGLLAELRCAIVRQDRGAPLSAAFSGAAGGAASMGIGFAPTARLGVDVSRRFGPIEPLVDLYLTTSPQAHAIQLGWVNDPVVAPSGVVLGRQEIRLSVPLGVAFVGPEKSHRPLDPLLRSFILGFEPWFVLAASNHVEADPLPRSYTTAGWGISFSIGVAAR